MLLVYLAANRDTPKPLCVVKISQSYIDLDFIMNEIRVLQRLMDKKLNIPTILSYSTVPQFIVEEFIEGIALEGGHINNN